jgi:hypothetical protein
MICINVINVIIKIACNNVVTKNYKEESGLIKHCFAALYFQTYAALRECFLTHEYCLGYPQPL